MQCQDAEPGREAGLQRRNLRNDRKKMSRRVVVTGLGVVAPNGVGIPDFESSLRQGFSGIRFQERLKELNFSCQVAGEPVLAGSFTG